MRNLESPFLADWFAISLRWLVLFGLTISLGIGGALSTPENKPNLVKVGMLCLPALWNGCMSALAFNNRRIPWHSQINVSLDVLFSTVLFAAAGGLRSEVTWIALLPVFTSAVYFEAQGALPVAVFMTALQTGYTYLADPRQFQPVATVMIAGFNLMAGVLVAMFSAPLVGTLSHTFQQSISHTKGTGLKIQRVNRDRMKTLFELIETLSSTLNCQTVLDTVLAASIDALGGKETEADAMVGAVLLFGRRNELEIQASHGFISHDLAIQLPGKEGKLNEVLKSGETQVIRNPGEDPELGRLSTLQRCSVAVCIPLVRSMNAFGVIVFAHTSLDFFDAERVESLHMLGNQAIISLQNARLYQDLAHEKERILQTQEEAQKKLARSLHDGPTQSISAIAMRLSIARRMLERSPDEAMSELLKIEDLARRATQEIRHMLFILRPLVLESQGLIPALKTMAEKMNELYQQKVNIEAAEKVEAQLDAAQQTTIFFLAEEAATNARKHASAAEIWVKLRVLPKDPGTALLEVIDNGVGFDVDTIMNSYDRRSSLGMINLRERTELINGKLKIESGPGKGTRVRVFIPLNEKAAIRLHQHR